MYSCLAVILCHVFVVCFSYHTLLELKYYDKLHKSLAAKGGQRMKGCPSWRQSTIWMWSYFLMITHDGRLVGPTAHSSSRGCFCMPLSQVRRRWSNQFAEATGKVSQGWMLGWMYPLCSSWDTKPPREEIQELYNEVYTLRRLPSPSVCGPEWAPRVNPGHFVLHRRSPLAKEG